MGNRPCKRCGKTTWFWSDPQLGCNLCNPNETPWAKVPLDVFLSDPFGDMGIPPTPMAQTPTPTEAIATPTKAIALEWNGDPLQGLRCTCTHTLAAHSPTRRRCLFPGCGCLTFTATEPYAPRIEH